MIVADPSTDVELCGTCSKVSLARGIHQCTLTRALVVLERGYCMCPLETESPGGLATLSPETQELYRPLIELSEQSLPAPQEAYETAMEFVPEVELPEAPGTALAVAEAPSSILPRRFRKRPKVKVLQLQPVADPNGETQVWAHPIEAPVAGSVPIPVIDGGGIITGPQPIPLK